MDAPHDTVMYCSAECERKLPRDGFKPCPLCNRADSEHFCNLSWNGCCVACSRERGLCVTCGRPNFASAAH